MSESPRHIPVLAGETLAALSPRPGEVFLDCTAGLGGHAELVAREVGAGGTVVLNDVDPGNLAFAAARVRPVGARIVEMRGNFGEAPGRLAGAGLVADMVLADLGFSSNQVEDPARGLSFSRDGPLDMRLDPSLPVTAASLIASLSHAELASLIREYGEDREAGRIAARIVRARAQAPITSTGQLAEVIRGERRGGGGAIDPATRTFQALRIAVNDELGSLNALLAQIGRGAATAAEGERSWLRAGARVVIISFHSLEDRAVKTAFRELASRGLAKELARRPVVAGEEECGRNPRARSAKLRAIALGNHSE